MTSPLQPKAALNLGLALIASSRAPILLLDGDLMVLAASASFCRSFNITPNSVGGRLISELGHGEWHVRQLESLLKSTAAGHADVEAYEMDLCRKGMENRSLVVNAQRLNYGQDDIRLLLSISDVTDARAAERFKYDILRDKETLLREKALLHQELQHRVANSLQIIASVLMQSARRVQSDETRTHLFDAHNRVMSIAAMQKQLSSSVAGSVHLQSYFADLCQSIGASMIRDPHQLSLKVTVDSSVVDAEDSMSLGLIVTELVINALKHAFPDHRKGTIAITYYSSGRNWTLSVGDDGVGIRRDGKDSKAGLGTSIVEALARQLKATIVLTDAHPGTKISLVHGDEEFLTDKSIRPAL
jgi:two-component sensor histidine kinase